MEIPHLHDWDLSPREARALQARLAPRLISDAPLRLSALRSIAGVDVSVKNKLSRAAVVLRYPELEIIEIARAEAPVTFPYIPGLLAFREGPVLLQALRQLRQAPDVLLFDGMGQLHPRRLGLAAHLGLWLGRPSIGCGKRHYIGDYEMPGPEKGSRSLLHYRGEPLGLVLRTRANVKPVYVSVGHLAELHSAAELVLACSPKFRLPIPIRAAHAAAKLA